MDSFLPSKDLPSSPWVARFPLEDYTFTSGNKNRSILAPEVPRIDDPKYYDQDPILPPVYPALTPVELDKLFSTESIQNERLIGMQTWKAAVLNRNVRFSDETGYLSGGHQPMDREKGGFISRTRPPMSSITSPILEELQKITPTNEEKDFEVYLRERIKVDETRWLPFLQNNRWFDWIQVSESFEDSQAGRTWSVDDPKLWGFLRISLELVNRILEALIEDKHEAVSNLQTILFGPIDYWSNYADIFGAPPSPDATVLVSYRTEQRVSQLRKIGYCPWDFIPSRSPEGWRNRLVKLLKTLVWGFGENSWGVEGQSNFLPMTTKNDSHYMLNPEMTLAELCMAQVDTALTMVHELMHSIVSARYQNDTYIGNNLHKSRSGRSPPEPYLDGAGVPEVGHYMEELFFGGTQFLCPSLRDIPVPPVVMVVRNFPWPLCTGSERPAPNCPALFPGAPIIVAHVPSTWASKLLSESFWQSPEPPKSANFFHRSSIFVSETPNDSPETAEARPRIPPAQQYSDPDDELAVKEWDERQRFWNSFRQDWYDEAKEKWNVSPWRFVPIRHACDEFALAFKKKDVLTCTRIAYDLVNAVKWNLDRPTYLRFMPTAGLKSPHWAFHGIGLLMMASIPRIRKQLYRGLDTKTSWFLELTPSMAAAAEGFDKPVYVPADHTEGDRKIRARPIKFYDQLRGAGEVPGYTQTDCLLLIDDMLTLIIQNEGIVHRNLLDAIISAKEAIYIDRRNIEVSYPSDSAHTTKWSSSWFFKFPPYDPTCCKFGPDEMELVC
ncbi:hypothetical protein F5B21DRAFT_521639 [Xylaria acuta]|nr:hypothetical protein F5B21DRAFT_521639 [Xylaria acuta]